MKTLQISSIIMMAGVAAYGQETDSIAMSGKISQVEVRATSGTKMKMSTFNTEMIGQGQLVRAACCNLGESFTTNPSVDVSYSDAATGARQIKLLGLSGTYVQMLTENIPNLRGASLPYSLGYVPGPWMQSIQVSKGASSVKNGYESTTGQINIEFLKPQGVDGVRANAYIDSRLKFELNADGSVHLNDNLSTSLLLHYDDRQRDHDANGDGFVDMPKQRQFNIMHRWAYVSARFISQLSARLLHDERQSGMTHHSQTTIDALPRYEVEVGVNRLEAQWKNAIITNADKNASVALMLHGSIHDMASSFGLTDYDVMQRNGYAQLMYETDMGEEHNLAIGASLNRDYYDENLRFDGAQTYLPNSEETTPGAYAQYTWRHGSLLTLMAGVRWDRSSIYGSFVTPRLHVKFSPIDALKIRMSAGKGYRTPHPIAENSTMLASGRDFIIDTETKQEDAWNCGVSVNFGTTIADRRLDLNAEYYYTKFNSQLVMDIDGRHGAHTAHFGDLYGKSYSHTMQVDATYPIIEGLDVTVAWRLNDVRTTYSGVLRRKPLTSRFKGLLTIAYKTPLELWHFDVTGQLIGRGERYDHTEYPTYLQLQAQVTREFRLVSVYAGGENLTSYKMKEPVIWASDPWGEGFDATQVWGPTDGVMFYIGMRFKLNKI